jgi:hypothetical protein
MWQDPIVEEIHQTREKIAQAYGNDIHAICEAARHGKLSKPLASSAPELAEQRAPAAHPAAASLRQNGA